MKPSLLSYNTVNNIIEGSNRVPIKQLTADSLIVRMEMHQKLKGLLRLARQNASLTTLTSQTSRRLINIFLDKVFPLMDISEILQNSLFGSRTGLLKHMT